MDVGSPSRSAALCWGQRWSWNEQRAPAEERTATLMLSRIVDAPATAAPADVHDAARRVVGRHEVLRSTFIEGPDGRPRQDVRPPDPPSYGFAEFDREADCLAWLRAPVDLASAWPLRIAVLHLPGGATGLGVSVHHIAADLYGFDLLCTELRAAVRAATRGVQPRLPVVGLQPADLAAFEQSPDGAAVNDRALRHWSRHDEELADVLGALRSGGPRPGGEMYVARVSAPFPGRLADLATTGHSTEGAVAVAAVACVLARHLGRTRIPLAMNVANRHREGLRQSVCAVTQSGLVSVAVPDPATIETAVPGAWAGMLTGMRHAYYDTDQLFERMTSLDNGGRHATVAPPSINIVRVGTALPGVTMVPRPDLSDDRITSWVGQCRRRCLGLHFHVQASARQLSVELRCGSHLLAMEDCHRLAAEALRLILG
jgi:hypothetical protein